MSTPADAAAVQAVLFDCDGVLVDSEALVAEVLLRVLADVGLPYEPRDFNTRFMGCSDAAFERALDEDSLERLGRAVSAEVVARANTEIRATFTERLRAIPGARTAVDAVSCRKAVVSSSRRASLRRKLDLVGLLTPFDPHVYSADDVTHAKPAPDLFLHAARAIGVRPSGCLVIEDSVNGVRAGRAAEMRVWGFLGGTHHDDESADRLMAAGAERVVADWDEARRRFLNGWR